MEIVIAVLGPLMGGLISLVVFVNKKNGEFMSTEFNRIHTRLGDINGKVDNLQLDVAKNYVTNEELTAHITGEDAWHIRFAEDMQQTRNEVTATRVIVDSLREDFKDQGKV
jgi:tRNA splicing endonuclease